MLDFAEKIKLVDLDGDPKLLTKYFGELIDAEALLLSRQAPLQAFLHWNILMSFEHLHFEDAVIKAMDLYGTEPYQSENAFFEHFKSGRILRHDLQYVLESEVKDYKKTIFNEGPTVLEFKLERLQHYFEIPNDAALEWYLAETDTLFFCSKDISLAAKLEIINGFKSESEALNALWQVCLQSAGNFQYKKTGIRRRDQLLELTGVDADRLIQPFLIRFTAAYLDQGLAYWSMPQRNLGMLGAFYEIYSLNADVPERWRKGLSKFVNELKNNQVSAEQVILMMLKKLEVVDDDLQEYIERTMLSLRGWAGMVYSFEIRPDKVPVKELPARLIDYLAIQLILDFFACNYIAKENLPIDYKFSDYEKYFNLPKTRTNIELAYESFLVAQELGLNALFLMEENRASEFVRHVEKFDHIERRRIYHLAYERRHKIRVLDGLYIRDHYLPKYCEETSFQAVFCMDEREESLRRYIEDLCPSVETFGYAGFFGVAMHFQGVDDIRPRPLCPPVVTAKNYVKEVLVEEELPALKFGHSLFAKIEHFLFVSSKTLVRGSFLATIFGLLSVIPLIGICIFPQFAAWLSRRGLELKSKQRKTKLCLECCGDSEDQYYDKDVARGFTVNEMSDIVFTALRAMGLDEKFARIVLIIGHGSSSMNNPHKAAYDCGATGGGKGGPNARAFSQMANDPRVRKILLDKGMKIPDTTYFVGAYHNTCDDSMIYYDEEFLPATIQLELHEIKKNFISACEHDAKERCRRFLSAGLDINFRKALSHVAIRSHDLAQPRAECGHATNAVAVIGRRSRTRQLFLDRRAFLVSYDPIKDKSGEILANHLDVAALVGSGINLDYYFSYIDPNGFGAGTKLPHNVTGLIGVMDGHASDLRTGLPWQMVEIHEPVRLLTIAEVSIEKAKEILELKPRLKQLVTNAWVQFVAWCPDTGELFEYTKNGFVQYQPESKKLITLSSSEDIYYHERGNLPYVCIDRHDHSH